MPLFGRILYSLYSHGYTTGRINADAYRLYLRKRRRENLFAWTLLLLVLAGVLICLVGIHS